ADRAAAPGSLQRSSAPSGALHYPRLLRLDNSREAAGQVARGARDAGLSSLRFRPLGSLANPPRPDHQRASDAVMDCPARWVIDHQEDADNELHLQQKVAD